MPAGIDRATTHAARRTPFDTIPVRILQGTSRVRIILASRSPRRIELLRGCGIDCEILPADIAEAPVPGESPADTARRLAREKARAASGAVTGTTGWILAADTVVALDGETLGKPADPAEARAMLERLRGRAHSVITAVCLRDGSGGAERVETSETRVWMRTYSGAEIEEYVATGDGFDKAGGYAIQSRVFHPAERLDGCYTNVVGLPLCRVYALLEQAGCPPSVPLPDECRHGGSCAFSRAAAR